MSTMIYELQEKTGKINKLAIYTVDPKRALINFIMQYIHNNFNTWNYPEHINGIRESDTVKQHFYYDDIYNERVLAAYPVE